MIAQLAGLQQLVAFTFILTFFGMSVASLFMLIDRNQVAARFRLSVTTAGLICAIAAGNYFFMRQIYVDGAISGKVAFPTEFRYIDWFLTVPLMLAQFPMHLGLGRRGAAFMARLVGLSVLMLGLGSGTWGRSIPTSLPCSSRCGSWGASSGWESSSRSDWRCDSCRTQCRRRLP
ncbi:MAG TPA: bacteriorhodopsin [Kineosporiaceae bacterium]|nr:bacteriorhodopsin [Kineosporiaceae bacterium]